MRARRAFALLSSILLGTFCAAVLQGSSAARDDAERTRIEALLQEGTALADARSFEKALERIEEAVDLAEKLGDEALTARALDLHARTADSEGDEAMGTALHERALEHARRSGDHAAEAYVQDGIGIGFWRRADYDAAMEHLNLALALQERARDRAGRAATLVLIGRVFFKQGRYPEALERHRQALSIQETTADRAGQAVTLEDVGDVLREQGSFAEAIAAYERSLALLEDLGDRRNTARLLTVLGVAYLRQGAPGLAYERFTHALDVAESADDDAGRATALYHLGIASSRESRFREATGFLRRASEIHTKLGDMNSLAWDLSFTASAYSNLGDPAAAADGYRRAIHIRSSIQDVRALASDLHDLGETLEQLGQDDEALATYGKALAIQEKIALPYRCITLGRMGLLRARAGDAAAAMDYGRRAVAAAESSGTPELRAAALRISGTIQRRLGRKREALDQLMSSIAIIEELRAGVTETDETEAGFLEDKLEVYSEAASLLLELGEVREALEISEKARARAFLDLLGGRAGRGRDEGSGEVTWRGGRELPSTTRVPPPDAAAIAGEAGRRDATIVEYMATADKLLIWVVRPDGSVRTASAPVGRREIEALVVQMRDALAQGSGAAGSGRLMSSLRRLHDILVEPIEGFLPRESDRIVTIVPHGPLFLVSFAALPDAGGRYFVERHALSYTPAIGVLRYTGGPHRGGTPTSHVLLVGYPDAVSLPGYDAPLDALPGVPREIDAIRKLYPPGQVQTLIGTFAKESRVRDLARESRVVHLATHGVLRDEDPLDSFVVLAPDPTAGGTGHPAGDGDGMWTVWEVLHAELDSDLVVLSACDTGLGRITGDGVAGLSRAFLSAGARSVAVNLWRLADVAGEYEMLRFHEALIAGRGRAAALREAQVGTLRALRAGRLTTRDGRPLAESPVYWAPFILVGEPG